MQFFEDHHEPDNRTAWAPLNLARYLIEKQDALDPDWQHDARALIEFVNRRFITVRDGVAVCGEQTNDLDPWGGILSTYGAVLAMYSKATGSNEYKAVARQALNYCLYAVNDDGCPSDQATRTWPRRLAGRRPHRQAAQHPRRDDRLSGMGQMNPGLTTEPLWNNSPPLPRI